MQVEEIFAEYETLVKQVDDLFAKVKNEFPNEVKCNEGCSDCCNAVFDLSLVEAMHLNRAFLDNFNFGALRSAILDAAELADRQATRHKRDLFQKTKQGATDEDIFNLAAELRIRCPLLGPKDSGQDESCQLYEYRPITCRLYGVPCSIEGKAHVCGLCAFEPGRSYPTIALDRIQDKLADLSRRLVLALGSRYGQLSAVYVPVSMALITKYDDDYLGVEKERE